jgi:anti-sigma B factor antagonist
MIEVVATPSVTTLVIAGDLDVAERDAFPEVRARIAGMRHGRLVVDMCGVTFMDSMGAAFLISLADGGSGRGSETVLRGAGERDLFVLSVCGVLDMFQIQADCDVDGHASARQ